MSIFRETELDCLRDRKGLQIGEGKEIREWLEVRGHRRKTGRKGNVNNRNSQSIVTGLLYLFILWVVA
jgi:hypothetical protein